MIEKLMLHIQYECHRRGIIIPWDHIVHRLNPGSSGPSALQHLNKMRDVLVTEGHLVPPLLGKVTVKQDPSIRGFVRDMDAELPTTTRIVRWDEPIEDRKEYVSSPSICFLIEQLLTLNSLGPWLSRVLFAVQAITVRLSVVKAWTRP
jgi:hypothetical protein